jgi:hypothetical protein
MDINAALARATLDEMRARSLTTPRLARLASMPERTLRYVLTGRQSVGARQIEAIARGLELRGSVLFARAEALMD